MSSTESPNFAPWCCLRVSLKLSSLIFSSRGLCTRLGNRNDLLLDLLQLLFNEICTQRLFVWRHSGIGSCSEVCNPDSTICHNWSLPSSTLIAPHITAYLHLVGHTSCESVLIHGVLTYVHILHTHTPICVNRYRGVCMLVHVCVCVCVCVCVDMLQSRQGIPASPGIPPPAPTEAKRCWSTLSRAGGIGARSSSMPCAYGQCGPLQHRPDDVCKEWRRRKGK